MATGCGSTGSKTEDILANEFYFPAFNDLCDENDLASRYWYEETPDSYTQACTWCFLGEITNDEASQIAGPMFRNRVYVRDRSGHDSIPITFHPNRGFFDFKTLRKGHTICVMLAEQHYFMDGTVGFRIEGLDLVKVIPCTLTDLLALSTTYSKCCDTRICWQCEHKADKQLEKCSACKLARYCNVECQTTDWKQTHKRWCKAIPEFIKMTRIDYSQYDENALFGPFSTCGRIW